MDTLYLLLALLIVIAIAAYRYLTSNYDYWERQNVPSMPNPIPGFGHILPIMMLKKNMPTFSMEAYKSTEASAIGFYFLRQPALIVRDPELVKSILQTNFVNFHNNGVHISEKADPVMAKNPFFMRDLTGWKVARARTTSHLSSKKLRHLTVIMREVCSKMDKFVGRKIEEEGGAYECDLKEHFIRYTGELVANAAFAVEGQSFEDKPDKESFTNYAKTIFTPTFLNGIKQAVLFYLPSVGNFFEISLLTDGADDFFRRNMLAILNKRKQENIAPNDYLQFCIDANGEEATDSIIADLIIFYGDVYETSSTVLSTVFYHLSQNVAVQEKLREHIATTIKANGGQLNYESLRDMNYLEQVIFESMRLLAPLGALMKLCTEEATLTGSDGLKYHFLPGQFVIIPVTALHLDSNYWTDPETFDPDRFSTENAAGRSKYVYLPFGEGPRMCIGYRLGLLLVKAAVASMLLNYSVEHSKKTRTPLELDTASLMLYIKGGLWASWKKLKKTG